MIATNQAIIDAALPTNKAFLFYKYAHDATFDFAKHAFELTGCYGKWGVGTKEIVSGGDLAYVE